jgi:putative serine protease PepD
VVRGFELPLRIGSGKENDVVLVREGISRNHCILQREGRAIVLVDTNSEFGTFVNGGRVTRHPLEEDDVIRLGTDVELAYEGR